MIHIDGLTKKQIAMLNTMWAMDSIEQIREWQQTLPIYDQMLCDTLMQMVAIAYIDEAIIGEEDCKVARCILEEISRK